MGSHVSPVMDLTILHKHNEQGAFKGTFIGGEFIHTGIITKDEAAAAYLQILM